MNEFDKYENISINIPTCFITKNQYEFIKKEANKKNVKQSKLIREITRRYIAKLLCEKSELVNANERCDIIGRDS